MTDRGVIYYAAGSEYADQALCSAKSLKQHNDLSVTVYTDQSVDRTHVDSTVTISPGKHPFYDRINYFKQTPYQKTLYLDTDTYVAADIGAVFELLDRFDVVAAFNESRNTAAAHTKFETVDLNVPDTFPEYQCGVLGYRNTDTVQELFNDWQTRYEPYREEHLIDQPHFREALYHSSASIGTLPTEYNVLVNFSGYLHSSVKLLHYAGTNKTALGDGLPEFERLQSLVNKLNQGTPRNRVFFHDGARRLRVCPREPSPLSHRAVGHVREHGVWRTVTRGLEKLFYE